MHDEWSLQDSVTFYCSFCGEPNDIDVDPSAGRRQSMIEDCQVCCRPNDVIITVENDGSVSTRVSQS